MDEAGSSGSAEFEDFDDDELWRAEDRGLDWIIDIFDILGIFLGTRIFFDAVEQQAGWPRFFPVPAALLSPKSLPRWL